LVNQIAHTLRNPIFAAMVQSEALLVRAGDIESIANSAQLVHRQLKRLEADIDEMLLYGRPASVSPRQIDLMRVVENVSQSFRTVGNEEPADMQVRSRAGQLIAELDPDAIKIILERLLRNAVQHTEPPHAISIELHTDDGGTVQLIVRDNGEGIADEIKDKMFLPFYPQHSGRPGLGLAVAAKFADVMGGHIEIESEEGEGTVASSPT
jgi:signal transduction histidine kinase